MPEDNYEAEAVLLEQMPKLSAASSNKLAIAILMLFAVKNATDAVLGAKIMILIIGLDLVLAYGLSRRKEKFRTLTIWRAIVGGIFWPLITFLQSGPFLGFIVGLTEWGFSGAMLLLLVGKTKRWRQITAMMVFLVFTFSIYGISIFSS